MPAKFAKGAKRFQHSDNLPLCGTLRPSSKERLEADAFSHLYPKFVKECIRVAYRAKPRRLNLSLLMEQRFWATTWSIVGLLYDHAAEAPIEGVRGIPIEALFFRLTCRIGF